MKKRILFVCLGNICRSPAAEGIMRALVEEHGLDDEIYIDSAGIGSWHVGEQPDRRMRKHAAQRGYDLSPLRARQFQSDDFEKFDWIVVMDEENYQDVMAKAPSKPFPPQGAPTRSLSPSKGEALLSSNPTWSSHRKIAQVVRMKDYFNRFKGQDYVPDPYYGGSEGFELALDMIEDGCKEMLKSLQQEV